MCEVIVYKHSTQGENAMTWIEEIAASNNSFRKRLRKEDLPYERKYCPYALITCMDPRVNPEAAGIKPFGQTGESYSNIRIIRTIGAVHEVRSLVIGIHLAGFKEVAVLMHTDCGLFLAFHNAEKILGNMRASLSEEQLNEVKGLIGELSCENLINWLNAFQDPYEAVEREVLSMKKSPFVPESLILHGLVYDLSSGRIDIVVNGDKC